MSSRRCCNCRARAVLHQDSSYKKFQNHRQSKYTQPTVDKKEQYLVQLIWISYFVRVFSLFLASTSKPIRWKIELTSTIKMKLWKKVNHNNKPNTRFKFNWNLIDSLIFLFESLLLFFMCIFLSILCVSGALVWAKCIHFIYFHLILSDARSSYLWIYERTVRAHRKEHTFDGETSIRNSNWFSTFIFHLSIKKRTQKIKWLY